MCAVLGIFQCTFHIPCMCCVLCLDARSCLTLCDPMGYNPPGSSLHGDSPGKNTRVGCHALQRIFKTQGLNPGLLYCRWILYHLSYQGSPRILERVTYPFSRESSWPRNRGRVSFIAGRFFTSWATREAIPCIAHKISRRAEIQCPKPQLSNGLRRCHHD